MLACHQIHDPQIICRSNVSHPVRMIRIRTIKVVVVIIFENLFFVGKEIVMQYISDRGFFFLYNSWVNLLNQSQTFYCYEANHALKEKQKIRIFTLIFP